jgi:signal transduction histidine kinase
VTQIRQQQAELAALNRGKDELIVTLAHELRQPLASMRMAVEVIRKRIGQEPGERARNVIDRQLHQLERLTMTSSMRGAWRVGTRTCNASDWICVRPSKK